MAQQSFPYTTFTDLSGNPLSNGYILIELSIDAQAPDGQICRGMTLRQSLNSSGVVAATPQVWPNSELNPSGSYYILRAYSEDGQLTLGPMKVQV